MQKNENKLMLLSKMSKLQLTDYRTRERERDMGKKDSILCRIPTPTSTSSAVSPEQVPVTNTIKLP